MNTSLGYAKKTLTNSNVLLSGGGDKALSEFIGSLNWDSTNKKLQYKSASSTDFTDLITFGSNAFTNYTGYDIVFLNNAGTTVDTFKALTSPSKTLKAGTNVQMAAASNIITITATDTTYSAGSGISLSGTTFSNSGVLSTTINGNYLRVNTDGTDADLTIPYATNADTLDGYHLNQIESIYSGGWCSGTGTYWGKVAEFKADKSSTVNVTASFLLTRYRTSGNPLTHLLAIRCRGDSKSGSKNITASYIYKTSTIENIPLAVTHIYNSTNECYYIRIYIKSSGWGETYGIKLLNAHDWSTPIFTNWVIYNSTRTGNTVETFENLPTDEEQITIDSLDLYTNIVGNASTATKLETAKTINGTSFNGSANITTTNWGTARTITIGDTGKSVNGSKDLTWSLAAIGAAALNHLHDYIKAKDTYAFTSSNLPNTFDLGVSAGFVKSDSGFGSYGSVLTVRTNSYGGSTLQLYAPYSANKGGTHLKARFGDYEVDNGNSWTDLKTIAWTEDIPTVNNGNLYLQASGVTKTTFTANLAGDSTFNIAEGTTDGTISVGGVDIPIHGLGDRAFDSTGYLPLAGGTMTGPIKRYYSSASDEPMIALTSYNLDVWLWRINHGSSAKIVTSAALGFGLKYTGTGSGNNRLILFADNLNETQVSSFTITQDGVVDFTSTPKVNSLELYYAGNIPSNSASAKGVVPAGVASSVYMTDANKNPSWTSIDSAVTSGSSNLVTSGAVFTAIANKVAGAVQYLGTITSEVEMKALSTAGYGDFARVATSFSFIDASGESVTAHVGDIVYLINNESNAYTTSSNWVVAHTEIDTDTWTAASTSASGYIPKLVTGGTNLETPSTDYVLAYVNGTTTPVWRKLPSNAYLNTWTAWVGATTDSNGTAGYLDAPGTENISKFLRGDGEWSYPYFAIENLTDWEAITTTTASNIDFTKVWWKIAPTSSNKVYGIGIHPSNGLLYYIYNNKGRYTATSYSANTGNTWRDIYTNGTSRVSTSIGSKAINFVQGDNITITYLEAGTSSDLSGDASYFNIKIDAIDTWIPWEGATDSADGTAGYMPAPTSAQREQFLRGDGSWVIPTDTTYKLTLNGTIKGTTEGTDLGTIWAPASKGTGFLKCTDGTWSYDNTTYATPDTTLTLTRDSSDLTKDTWMDAGTFADSVEEGTWIISFTVDGSTYSGVFSRKKNDTMSEEINLHAAGTSTKRIYARTSGNKFLIATADNTFNPGAITFKFRKLI